MRNYWRYPILENEAYRPFGLTMERMSDKALKSQYAKNKYRYNGKAAHDYKLAPRYYTMPDLMPSKGWMEMPRERREQLNGTELIPLLQKVINRFVKLPMFVPPNMFPQQGPALIP